MHVSPTVIPIIGILMPLLLVPIVMTMRLRQRKREWEHLERMKSMELGVPPLPASSGPGGAAAIGTLVPFAAIVSALFVTLDSPTSHPHDIPIAAVAWSCATIISISAMVIALILGVIQARTQGKMAASSSWSEAHAKPAFDPEAYEFAGHRG